MAKLCTAVVQITAMHQEGEARSERMALRELAGNLFRAADERR
jgi:hypothetical protein